MDKNSGIFTVKQGGTYQFTFTGFIASIRGHMVSTDLYLRRSQRDRIIGRASAKTDEDGIFGMWVCEVRGETDVCVQGRTMTSTPPSPSSSRRHSRRGTR